jgi:AcrR family transcriptional regulator
MDENIILSLARIGIVTATFRKLESEKKQAIYQNALKEFCADIFDRVSLDKIASSAGISKGSLLQYFTHKENLLNFISEIFLSEYERHWDNYFSREHPIRARDRVAAYLVARFDSWEKERLEFGFYMKMQYENSIDISRKFRERILALRHRHILEMVERGIRTGEIRGDLEPDTIAFFIQSLARNLEIAYHLSLGTGRGKFNIREAADKLTLLIFDGISS